MLICSYHAVLLMGGGMDPTMAAQTAISKIAKFYPDYQGAVIAMSIQGKHGMMKKNDLL